MRVFLATTNPGKLRELKRGLAPLGWTFVTPDELPYTPPEETGMSFEDNALLKAAAAAQQTGLPALADDSGLEVDALGGEPGVYSARYGGFRRDVERNLYLLERLKGVPPEKRTARFVAVLVLAYPDGHVEVYRGETEGRILEAPRGHLGFGYDPLFFVPEAGRTFAEMLPDEKARYSHRGKAIRALLEAWKHGPPPREIKPME